MDISLSAIRGIGPARLQALARAGIDTVRDLVMLLPREYRDLRHTTPLREMQMGVPAAVSVRVIGEASQRRAGGLLITRTMVSDGTDAVNAVWYNQPWLKKQLTEGRELLLYGRLEAKRGGVQLSSPVIEQETGIVPVYRAISGIPAKSMRQMIAQALSASEDQWPDELPAAIREKYGLCERNFAMRQAHFPDSEEALSAARYRLSFEELLLYQVALGILRGRGGQGVAIPVQPGGADAFWRAMPFPPTGAQARVLDEIAGDMAEPKRMSRLVQGDVGCGKTAIAFGAILLCVKGGYQAAMMAPTEVLARQHYDGAMEILAPLGVRVGLLTGSMTQKQHRAARDALAVGEWDLVIGTHALITENVVYRNLGLVVTDEQHRFGVNQRAHLAEKGESPNVLVMSATPIPRTLSLILYGDLDISVVDELPPGRKSVKTRIVPEEKRSGMYRFLRDEAAKGHQIYVVCPLVEDSEAIEASSAQEVFQRLRDHDLAGLRVELAHGKMKSRDKDQVLERFRAGEADVLVSTTVIEVGVNVPNATVMVIEDADRFGLAQLHQLRGRVGRGADESWCFLMAEPNERLRLLASTSDGFVVAQKDLELRGPGEMMGTRQSGAAAVGLNLLAGDTRLLGVTHDLAREIVSTPENAASDRVIRLADSRFGETLTGTSLN